MKHLPRPKMSKTARAGFFPNKTASSKSTKQTKLPQIKSNKSSKTPSQAPQSAIKVQNKKHYQTLNRQDFDLEAINFWAEICCLRPPSRRTDLL